MPKKGHLYGLPNLLTLLRIAILIPLAWFLRRDQGIVAAILLAIAAFTDFLDGYLARRNKQESSFGQLMDPVADKILLCVCTVFLVADPTRPLGPWLATLLLAREFLITGLRAFVATFGIVMPAGRIGKYKAVFQFIGLGGVMVGDRITGFPFWSAGVGILWISVGLSYWSMSRYLMRAYRELRKRKAL